MATCFSFLGRIASLLGRHQYYFWVPCAALLLTLPSLCTGLAGDDYFMRAVALQNTQICCLPHSAFDLFAFVAGGIDPAIIKQGMATGLYPWWTHPHLTIAFFRPFAAVTHWLDFRLCGNATWLMHVHSIGWYALLVLITGFLYKRLVNPFWSAGLATLLYALDYSHAIGAASLCNRNAVMAAVFGFLALLNHDRWRRDHITQCGIRAWVCFFLSLLCAEAGFATLGYLVAYALFLDNNKRFIGWAALLPYVISACVWRILYLAGGYGVAHSGVYTDPGTDPLRFIGNLGMRLPVLLQGQFSPPPADLWAVLPPTWAVLYAVAAATGVLFVAWSIWPLLRRDVATRFFATGMMISAIPFCATVPSNRFLFFIGLGCMGIIARYLAIALDPPDWFLPYWRRMRQLLACGWIIIWLFMSPVLLALLSLSPLVVQRPLSLAAATITPREWQARPKHVVVVSLPSDLMLFYVPFIRAAAGQDSRLRTLLLSAGSMPVTIQRVNDRTLAIRYLDDGLFAGLWSQVFRDAGEPLKQGVLQKLDLCSVMVTRVNDGGLPSEITFEFAVPLEDESLHWVIWSDTGFRPFRPPASGVTVMIKPAWLLSACIVNQYRHENTRCP